MINEFFPHGTQPWINADFDDPYRDLAARHLEGDEWLVLRPMLTSVRLAVMTWASASVEHWCYRSIPEAMLAWWFYPQELAGWSRHVDRTGQEHHPNRI